MNITVKNVGFFDFGVKFDMLFNFASEAGQGLIRLFIGFDFRTFPFAFVFSTEVLAAV